MNYSTIKKTLVFSLVAMLGLGEVSLAQTATSSSAKVFGGRSQYRTWSLGINAGVLAPKVVIGGTNDFNKANLNLGYGLSLRKQLGHAFGLEFAGVAGKLSGENETGKSSIVGLPTSFETDLGYALSLSGVANVATVDFLQRENSVNFVVKAGMGYTGFAPRSPQDWKDKAGEPYGSGTNKYVKELYVPVGAGVKFKVSERVNFDLSYVMNFLDGDNLDGTYAKGTSKDKWSYTSAGLEFSLGSAAKPNLDWVNPLALMYDELKDPTLRQEVEALKGRVSALEAADLLKDSDGDGVADKLDKCPNTEAGIKVDGSGCPLDVDADGIPDSKDACPTVKGTAALNGCPEFASSGPVVPIQFEFNSSVLKTSAYSTLDKLSSDLKANSSAMVQLDGHASAEGTEEYNMSLSRDRANSVKTYLVNSGIAASRVAVTAYGESRPVASNATEAGRVENRRVEIKQQ
ncbi:OmpA-OmpF porin, OOP family [Daejeonella rubra]|uniref:OmpA-OmpF porin, OOP family n=1 Tax=Daejeonella rubra TaxID=990371 RepID=A0A1G9R497_9SPHI|nr:OmpA family protein [Daejeonella rubra]SDM17950.1 OmpA-OmpF porin, OOP family [Daejeonella rubra]